MTKPIQIHVDRYTSTKKLKAKPVYYCTIENEYLGAVKEIRSTSHSSRH